MVLAITKYYEWQYNLISGYESLNVKLISINMYLSFVCPGTFDTNSFRLYYPC
jgi:hypothetical protein